MNNLIFSLNPKVKVQNSAQKDKKNILFSMPNAILPNNIYSIRESS